MKAKIENSIFGDIIVHLDREVTQDYYEYYWKGKYRDRTPQTLSEKLLKIPEIEDVGLYKRYRIELRSEEEVDWDKIIPKIKEVLREYFEEEIEYIEKEPKIEWKERSKEIPIKHRLVSKALESFCFSLDKIERQPKMVKRLFEIPGIININVWSDHLTIEKGEVFTWDEVLSKVNKLIAESEEIMKEDKATVLVEERKLIEKIKKSIPNPKLPVLYIRASGDEEGKTSMDLGYWNGQIEDILRKVAPLANRAPVKGRLAEYEICVIFYTNPSEMLTHAREYGIPSISFVPSTPKKGFKVLVGRFYSQEDTRGFVKLLRPETPYEILDLDEDSTSVIVEI